MPLLGVAAMLLSFDIVPESVTEHDDWHTHEHFPERLSIPGFRRGSRWTAIDAVPRYFVLYEVAGLETLTSAAYLERLNNPTPWTTKMMQSYRGMTRGLCEVVASHGLGLGHAALLVRLAADGTAGEALRTWLCEAALPSLAMRPGASSAHLFRGAVSAPMTNEQRIRGADRGVDWALLVTGYDGALMARLKDGELSVAAFEQKGATVASAATYRIGHVLTAWELSVRRGAQD